MAVRDVVQAAAGVGGGSEYVEDVFSTYLYTGTGLNGLQIQNGIDLAGEGGMVWVKSRSNGDPHWLVDTERGLNKSLQSNSTNAENTGSQQIVSFDSDGFTLGNRNEGQNYNGLPFASWTFRKAPKFFDVVTYTGNGVAGREIAHNLGSAPGMVIVKDLGNAYEWECWHRGLPIDNVIRLDTNDASFDEDIYGINFWNKTLPTSTHVTLGNYASVNGNGNNYVMYLFAHDAGGFGDDGEQNVISCGTYTGNGSSTGPVVNLGYEPQFVMMKNTQTAGTNWVMFDNMRGVATDGSDAGLFPNLTNAEAVTEFIDFNATGFQLKNISSSINQNAKSHIYIAIRRGPMKTPESGTEVLESVAYTGDGSTNRTIGSSLTADMVLLMDRDATSASWSTYAQSIFDRSRGDDRSLATSNSNAESTGWANTYFNLDQQIGWSNGSNSDYTNKSGTDYVTHHFRRAPGFFDVVAYKGDGNATKNVSHNLGITPEIVIVKSRSQSSQFWNVFHKDINASYNLALNSNSVYDGSGFDARITGVSTTNFTVKYSSPYIIGANAPNEDYIAYIFASCPVVSKIGTYTGTGADINVDCGFSAGARFVLIKRTDDTGDWYVWDSARGIVAGNDPYLLLNSPAAENTSTDYIDPLASGFTVTSSAPAALNASGGSYIFLAIA